jgi:hypothetical protein
VELAKVASTLKVKILNEKNVEKEMRKRKEKKTKEIM